MVSLKLPDNIQLEDLLEALDSKVEGTNSIDPIVVFLQRFDIKPGNERVTGKLLYNLYNRTTKNPYKKIKFSLELNKYISKELNSNYFLINQPFEHLNELCDKVQRKHDKVKSPTYHQHFQNFLRKYHIEESNQWVEDYILYNLYDSWSYSIHKKHPLSKEYFYRFCNIYFEKQVTKTTTYYGVNKNVLDYLSDNLIRQLRERHNEEYKRKGKKENQSKKSD